MSGGHFDYQNYRLLEIVETLEQDIREAEAPRPEKVLFHSISVILEDKDIPNCGAYLHTPDYVVSKESAVKWLKKGAAELKKVGEDLWSDGNNTYRIKETDYYDYPDRNWRLELKPETIKILKDTVEELRTLYDKLNLIDYVMAGDSGENELIEKYDKRLVE